MINKKQLTVGELIKILKHFDKELPVGVQGCCGACRQKAKSVYDAKDNILIEVR